MGDPFYTSGIESYTSGTESIGMKIAVVGKGGVGKTTLSSSLARRLAGMGRTVIAVDADPDGNLASALGVPEEQRPEPIADMRDLILERTDAQDQGAGLMFKLNPDVSDLPERFSVDADGVKLLVLGTVETGGKGCMCPEGAVLKALMQHLLLRVADDVILDMEAGLEHMGRASATGVDALLAVVEPGMRSVQTATRVQKLAGDIGIKQIFVVLNKVRNEHEDEVLRRALSGQNVIGMLPYDPHLARADLEGRPVDLDLATLACAVHRIGEALENRLGGQEAEATN
ncbi:MAG: ATP-binding protein [Planctomycetota bacterium]|jgi:CO dehydrogenase maturation factor